MQQNNNSGTIWTAIGAIASIIALYFPIRSMIKKKRKKVKVLISMQMSHLSDAEYEEIREDIMHLIYDLRKHHEVYFYNEFVPKIQDFDKNKFNPLDYLLEIKKSDWFIAIITEKILSSIYFEAGYALAAGVNSVYFVTDDKVMPLVMRMISADHPKVKVIRASSINEIKPRIVNLLNNSNNIEIA